MDTAVVYLGTLGAIAFLATGGMLYVLFKDQGQKGQKRKKKRTSRASGRSRRPQAQVVWESDDVPLIWVVDGHAYRHPDSVTIPEHRATLNALLKELHPFVAAATDAQSDDSESPEPLSSNIDANASPVQATDEAQATDEVQVTDGAQATDEAQVTDEAQATDEVQVTDGAQATDDESGEVVAEAPPAVTPGEEPDQGAGEAGATGPHDTATEQTDDPAGEDEGPAHDREPEAELPARTTSMSYEEEMNLPLIDRLKASFFGSPAEARRPADRLDHMSGPAIPRLETLNDLIQQRLQSLDDPPRVSIQAGEKGLLEIVVSGQVYERVDDVPHEEVRQVMQEAVQVWEKQIL